MQKQLKEKGIIKKSRKKKKIKNGRFTFDNGLQNVLTESDKKVRFKPSFKFSMPKMHPIIILNY